MTNRKLRIFMAVMALLTLRCGVFEPREGKGSIAIVLTPEKQEQALGKALEALNSVRYILKKGTATVKDDYLTKNGSYFEGTISGLDSGNDYSVLLYGKNSNSDIIARGYQSSITVNSGETATVIVSWAYFKPVLFDPSNDTVMNDNTPTFNWDDVNGASVYELQVDNSSNFGSPEIHQTNLTASTFTISSPLSDGTYYWRVRSKDSQGNLSGWSSVLNFIISTQGLSTPTLSQPSNGSSTNDNIPTFDWSDVSGAVQYELQVSTSNGFSTFTIQQPSLTTSTFTPATSLSDGTYYWRVRCRVSNGNWGGWSSTWSFTISTQGPSAPTLSSPSHGSTIADNTPAFDWSDVSGAAVYELVVDNSSSFSSPEIDQASLTSSTYTATSSLSDGTYYWRVRTKDSQDNWGGWSSTKSFTISTQGTSAPSLSLPANGNSTNDNTPSFDWSDVSGTVQYELQVSGSSGFGSYAIHQTALTISFYTSSSSLSDGMYYWRVRAKDSQGNWGAWSEVWSFTISSQVPPVPSLSAPANGSSTTDNTPSFDWNDVSSVVQYELQVSSSSSFTSFTVQQSSLTSNAYTSTTSLSDGTYYWRVRCRDSNGNWGGWSSTWSFTIDTQVPDSPTLLSPPNGATITDNTPAFDWSNVGGASFYELEVDGSSTFSSPEIEQTSLSGSNYTVTTSLSDGVYYWRVRCQDSNGNWGAWSGTWSFTIETAMTGTFTDINGNVYSTVKIGNQWWMAENLRVTRDRNGNSIANITSTEDWLGNTETKTPAYCVYNNNNNNEIATYGCLYNWYAALNVAPAGWHLPSKEDWDVLISYLGGESVAGGKLKMTGTNYWNSPNTGATNESGFSAIGVGYRSQFDGGFYNMGRFLNIWSSTESVFNAEFGYLVYHLGLNYNDAEAPLHDQAVKNHGFSIRLIKD